MMEKSISVFFTYGASVEHWNKIGFGSREITVLQKMRSRFSKVCVISYDRRDPAIEGLHFLYNRWGLPNILFSLLAPFFYAQEIKASDIYYMLQPKGFWMAGIAARLYRKPWVLRVGFVWLRLSEAVQRNGIHLWLIRLMEQTAVRSASKVIATSPSAAHWIKRRYQIPQTKLFVIPNGVDTSRFAPDSKILKVANRLLYVGRLSEEKNIDLILEAMKGLNCELTIVGRGKCERSLRKKAQEANLKIDFLGVCPNDQLPAIYNRAEIFVMPSSTEGCPKALLEALSCSLAVVTTNWDGVEDFIHHERDGLVCSRERSALRNALGRLLQDKAFAKTLGLLARKEALIKYDFESVMNRLFSVFESLIPEKSPRVEDSIPMPYSLEPARTRFDRLSKNVED